MRLLLVRHGESICGVNGIVGGPTGCSGLTERGLAQARALRDRFAAEEMQADVLLASTLPRARQTAEVIAEALALDVVLEPDLVEFMPGELDGTRWEDWGERFNVMAEPDRPLSPGGESRNAFWARVGGLFDRLAGMHDGKTIVAACHGGIVWSSRRVLLGLGNEGVEVDFTSVTEWRREDGRWDLVCFNDVAHLEGTDLLPARAEA